LPQRARSIPRPKQIHFDIACKDGVETAFAGKLIPPQPASSRRSFPRSHQVRGFCSVTATPCRLPHLRVTHRCSIRILHQCVPGGTIRIARQLPPVIYPPQIRSPASPIRKTRNLRAVARHRRMRHPACAGITHPPPKKCHSIPQTESSVNPWKLRAARREQKVRPAKAVPLVAACHSRRRSVQRLARPER